MINVAKLRSDGYVYMEYPFTLRESVRIAMESWEEFCALPDEIKLCFPYCDDAVASGYGYELKRSDVHVDQKENFDLRFSAWHEILRSAGSFKDLTVSNFVIAGLVLSNDLKSLLMEFAEAVETEFRVYGFVEAVQKTLPDAIVRFIHYFGNQESGKEIAAPHTDKRGFTLHLSESSPGVEFLTRARKWEPLSVTDDQTVIFPALKLQYFLESNAKALCHRVVATSVAATQGRFSAVCFVDFRGGAHYNKERYGRIQNFPAGFNYDMSWEEFKKLFVTAN